MLVSLNDILPKAKIHHYAVGAFNVFNLESAHAVIAAAEEERSPIIMQTSEKALQYAGFADLAELLVGMATRSSAHIVVHLDHGSSVDVARHCLEAGYSSVMVDFSKLPLAENIEKTATVVKIARVNRASVEGELGRIIGREDGAGVASNFTNPEEAEIYVKETKISALAVGIGNAHGPEEEKELDFELLSRINERVDIPLVLHGASSIERTRLKKAIGLGVAKINIDTALRQAFTASLKQNLRANPAEYDPRDIIGAGMVGLQKSVIQHIEMFGSKDKV